MQVPRLSRAKIVRCAGLVLIIVMAAAPPAAALEFACTGTEPFWSLTIGGEVSKYSDPEGVSDTLTTVEPRPAAGTPGDYALVFETYSTARRSQTYTVVIRKDDEANCSDGMSDTDYPYSTTVILPDRVLLGCCHAR